jgi:SAM-dependent methyltransferase
MRSVDRLQPGSNGGIDRATLDAFGREWSRFDQSKRSETELLRTFSQYFRTFPWDALPHPAVGFDLGCGTGRWARIVSPRVGTLYCIDASEMALRVAARNLGDLPGCRFFIASAEAMPLRPGSVDFGYSLGVLHHTPDPAASMKAAATALKPGAPFLIYMYYALENRPPWYKALWRASDALRRSVGRSPWAVRYSVTQLIAASIYWPLARIASLLEKVGVQVDSLPLSAYRHRSFYAMRTDALDRFGTLVEKRFTAQEITRMMEAAGLEGCTISPYPPYWCVVGYKRR